MAEKLPEFFWTINSDLPRGETGDNKSTQKAYRMLKDSPKNPHILDVDCGPGMQTVGFAKLSEGRIVVLDFHEPFVEQLREVIKKEDNGYRVKLVKGDIFKIEFKDNRTLLAAVKVKN